MLPYISVQIRALKATIYEHHSTRHSADILNLLDLMMWLVFFDQHFSRARRWHDHSSPVPFDADEEDSAYRAPRFVRCCSARTERLCNRELQCANVRPDTSPRMAYIEIHMKP